MTARDRVFFDRVFSERKKERWWSGQHNERKKTPKKFSFRWKNAQFFFGAEVTERSAMLYLIPPHAVSRKPDPKIQKKTWRRGVGEYKKKIDL